MALLERSLLDFAEACWHVIEPGVPFIVGDHVVAICAHLEAVTSGTIEDLVVNMPPGMSKSKICGVIWPAWVWTRKPEARFLCASYEQSLATRDNVACRELVNSHWYQSRWGQKVRIKDDDNQKTKFSIEAGGWRMATTPRGRGTGEHPDFVLADDPHNVKQAESDVERQVALNWWDRTISVSRGISRNSRRVICMQRLHELDMSGHVRTTRPWAVHLVLPMEFDPHLPHGSFRVETVNNQKVYTQTGIWSDRRQAGELLCTELIGARAVEKLKITMHSKASGQLQQNPLPDEGAILARSMFRTFEVDYAGGSDLIFTVSVPAGKGPMGAGAFKTKRYLSSQCWWFQAADTAVKDGEENDYTAIGTFILTPGGELLVYDVFHEKITVPNLYPVMMELRKLYPRILCQAVEDKSSGEGLIQMGRERGTPFLPLKIKGSKKERALPMATWYAAGRIFHRQDANWRRMLEDNLVGFPDTAHKDLWDMMAYGVQMLHQGLLASFANLGRSLITWPDPEETEREKSDPLYDAEDHSGTQFDLARKLGII